MGLVLLAGLSLAGLATLRLANARLEANVYRARLAELSADYQLLRGRYGSLIRETAVTELVVEDGALAVSIRTAEGELRRIETPYDPTAEIYVDYVVRGGHSACGHSCAGRNPSPGDALDSRICGNDRLGSFLGTRAVCVEIISFCI